MRGRKQSIQEFVLQHEKIQNIKDSIVYKKINNTLDLYSDYLIVQNKYATSTGLSEMLNGAISHDKVTRFLNKEELTSKELWRYIKADVRSNENSEGTLILDDSIEEKPYTNENEINLKRFRL